MKREDRDLPTAIVVGSGAGGAACAQELQGRYRVTVLEEGGPFRPLALSIGAMERLRHLSPLLGRRLIGAAFPAMRLRPTPEEMLLVNGRTLGGSTVLSTANALRSDRSFREIGLSLDRELGELASEVPATTAHERRWSGPTRRLYEAFAKVGLDPVPTPKMIDAGRCRLCGRCVLGCPYAAKWDSRRFLEAALASGARLASGCSVESLELRGSRATAVRARLGARRLRLEADLIVLAAGGLGTPAILERSGIACERRLFVDPVLVVAAHLPESRQQSEIPMPFYAERPGYLLSPYFDYLSFILDRRWRLPADEILGLMIKLADSAVGEVLPGRTLVEKRLTVEDRLRLAEAQEQCRRILIAFGAAGRRLFLGTLNAGHPGGMVRLRAEEAQTLHPRLLPDNVYVADASLFPASAGGPPILTILALARRVARAAAAAQLGPHGAGPTAAASHRSGRPRRAL